MKDKICPKCKGNGFLQCTIEEDDKEFDDYFDSYRELKPLLKH